MHDPVMDRSREVTSELRRLLDLAEGIQAKYESATRRRNEIFAQEVIVAVIGAIGAGIVGNTLNWGRPLALGLLVGAAGFVAFMEITRGRLSRQAVHEERALEEVVSIVREVETAMARDEDWSPLERAEFRIRLSRFDA